MVIKGCDKERWVTISRIAVLLKVGTAMAAEVAGVFVLTGILDLVFNKCLTRFLTNGDEASCGIGSSYVQDARLKCERRRMRASPQGGVERIRNMD